MKLRFLGAATTVTGSQFLLTTERARVIIDCGMFQGAPAESARNRLPLAYDPRTIDAIVLTHAHLDHCGYLPVVVREGYAGTVWTTHPSVELVRLVLVDSGKVQAEQAKVRRRRAKQALRNGGPGAPPPRVAEGDDHERAMRGQPPVLQTESLDHGWIDVPPANGTIVVNLGDCMQAWTNDRYRAAVHRVVPMTRQRRFSIPYFSNPSRDAMVEPVAELCDGAPRYRAFAWREFMAARAYDNFTDLGVEDTQVTDFRVGAN